MAHDGRLLDPATLRELLRHLEQTDVDELEVVSGEARLYLRREPGKRGAVGPGERPREAPAGVPIVAPLTGVFYARSSPDQSPYVAPGDVIQPGQVVALIETMKLFNEVVAEIAGEVLSIAVDEGDLIEAGQPILYVRPGGAAL
ncbi:MAG TPA: biotin/lipoyl-containing protein [Chloroflexota bacterium]|nr:biotin/lipoyl-containing protein [Chloroflexota bacterium]